MSMTLLRLPAFCAQALIRAYRRWISPLWPPTCRYQPSCSEYALTAVGRFGVIQGGWLALRRLLRCHPFGGWGFDPVPESPCPGPAHTHSDPDETR